MDISFDDVKNSDFEAIRDIYNYYVLNTTVTFHIKPVDIDELKHGIYVNHPKYKSILIKSGDIYTRQGSDVWPVFGKRGEQVLEPVSTIVNNKAKRFLDEIESLENLRKMRLGEEEWAAIQLGKPEYQKYIKQVEELPVSTFHQLEHGSEYEKYYSLLKDMKRVSFNDPSSVTKTYYSPLKGLKYGGLF